MNWLLASTTSAIVAFIATNIDDLIVLTVFFSQVNARFRSHHVVTGQYLGFTALVVASLPGFFGGRVIPEPLIGFLGFIPILLGMQQWRDRHKSEVIEVTESESLPEFSPKEPCLNQRLHHVQQWVVRLLNPQTYTVAAVTVANGGDNIGIYVPLFASSTAQSLVVTLMTFFMLVGVWCVVAASLTQHPTVATLLARYGNTIVPIVLVGLGIYILIENGTLGLIAQTVGRHEPSLSPTNSFWVFSKFPDLESLVFWSGGTPSCSRLVEK